LTEDEAAARAINAQPWKPLPRMIKRQCSKCRYWFATLPSNKEERCKDCANDGGSPPIAAADR
jgi:hypothetical protein